MADLSWGCVNTPGVAIALASSRSAERDMGDTLDAENIPHTPLQADHLVTDDAKLRTVAAEAVSLAPMGQLVA